MRNDEGTTSSTASFKNPGIRKRAVMASYKTAWGDLISKQLRGPGGYVGVVERVRSEGSPWLNYHRLASPGGAAEHYLMLVVEIGSVAWKHQIFEQFLKWAVETADRILADPRFEIDPGDNLSKGWKVKGIFPGNHGEALAAASFSHAISDDSETDASKLRVAAREIAESALFGGARMWDVVAQSRYLRAARILLVAGAKAT